jgi:hypothetical protein
MLTVVSERLKHARSHKEVAAGAAGIGRYGTSVGPRVVVIGRRPSNMPRRKLGIALRSVIEPRGRTHRPHAPVPARSGVGADTPLGSILMEGRRQKRGLAGGSHMAAPLEDSELADARALALTDDVRGRARTGRTGGDRARVVSQRNSRSEASPGEAHPLAAGAAQGVDGAVLAHSELRAGRRASARR